ncbi:MAG TPA: LysR family transcriptional regulator [Paracoccaceae bacterium]|nr:LysR family transcriptional regulator [Paracoccaceae bacterium]
MIDRLEMFLALAREGHFGRAAEACGVTQPTLSSALRQLEDQLGVQLVFRGSRYQGLTPEGERALVWARRMVADARALRQDMRAARTGLSGTLRLGVIPTALPMVASLTAPLADRHPALAFRILSRTSAEILTDLESLELDAGITYLDNEPLGRVAQVPLYTEFYRLLCRTDGPLAGRDRIGWAELADLPLCLLPGDMQNRRIVNQLLAEAGATAAARIESNSTIALVAHVKTGRWVSIVPMALAQMFTAAGDLAALPITDPEAEHTVGLVTARRDPVTPMVQALIDAAERMARGG